MILIEGRQNVCIEGNGIEQDIDIFAQKKTKKPDHFSKVSLKTLQISQLAQDLFY